MYTCSQLLVLIFLLTVPLMLLVKPLASLANKKVTVEEEHNMIEFAAIQNMEDPNQQVSNSINNVDGNDM